MLISKLNTCFCTCFPAVLNCYVYYIKGGDLMRADLNADMGTEENPVLVADGVGKNVILKDYSHTAAAEDGSFSAFSLAGDDRSQGEDFTTVVVKNEDAGLWTCGIHGTAWKQEAWFLWFFDLNPAVRIDGMHMEDSILKAGKDYFAVEAQGEEAGNLLKLSEKGTSERIGESTLCGVMGEKLVFLSGEEQYPYKGVLSYYDGSEVQAIDKKVVTFFLGDRNRFADVIPRFWNWKRQDESGDAL